MAIPELHSKIKYTNILDPRLKCMQFAKDDIMFGIYKGTQNSNFSAQNANSYGTSNVEFSFNTQGSNSLIDRRIYLKMQFLVTLIGTAPIGVALIEKNYSAPRAFPIMSITDNLSVNINGNGINTRYNKVMKALLRFNTVQNGMNLLDYDLSGSPSFLDNYQLYSDGTGALNNPLADYQNSVSKKLGRGAFYVDAITNPLSVNPAVPITATVLFTVIEPIIISPFLYSSQILDSALAGVTNMALNFGLSAGNLDRVWSQDVVAGVTITSLTTSIGSGVTEVPQLLINYLNAPSNSLYQTPTHAFYQYNKTEAHIDTTSHTLAPNASAVINNGAIQMSYVPKAIYVYAQRATNSQTYLTTDTFLSIENITINFLSVSGQLSTASQNDLYNMSVKNGLDMSYTEFRGITREYNNTLVGLSGAPILIGYDDLSIPENYSVGMPACSQFEYTVTVKNNNQVDNVSVELVTIFVYDGVIEIYNDLMHIHTGFVTPEILNITRNGNQHMFLEREGSLYGGDLWDKFKSFAKTSCNVLTKALPFADMAKKAVGLGKGYANGFVTGGELMYGSGSAQGASKTNIKNAMKKFFATETDKSMVSLFNKINKYRGDFGNDKWVQERVQDITAFTSDGDDQAPLMIEMKKPKQSASKKRSKKLTKTGWSKCPTGERKKCVDYQCQPKGGELVSRSQLLKNIRGSGFESELNSDEDID